MLPVRLQETFPVKLQISMWLPSTEPRSPLDYFVQEVSVRDCTHAKPLGSTAGSELRALEERMGVEEGGVTPTAVSTTENSGNRLQVGVSAGLSIASLVPTIISLAVASLAASTCARTEQPVGSHWWGPYPVPGV